MSVGYATANALTGLAATAFTWSSGYTTGRSRLNDGLQDELAAGSASAQAPGQTLAVDLGSATALVGVALLNHNLAAAGYNVKVEGADDSGFSVNLVTAKAATTIETTAPWHKDAVLQFPSVTKRYWRLTFSGGGSLTVTLGELQFLTSITTLSRQPIYGGYAQTERYVTNRVESRTGQTRSTYLAGPIRSLRLPFKDSSTSQKAELFTMWRATRGGTSRLLWLEYIESDSFSGSYDAQHCLWGRVQETLGWVNADYGLYDVDGLELIGEGREVGS